MSNDNDYDPTRWSRSTGEREEHREYVRKYENQKQGSRAYGGSYADRQYEAKRERGGRASGGSWASGWSGSAVVEEANPGIYMSARERSQLDTSAEAAKRNRAGRRGGAAQGGGAASGDTRSEEEKPSRWTFGTGGGKTRYWPSGTGGQSGAAGKGKEKGDTGTHGFDW